MKKVIFETIGNIIMLILLGFSFTQGIIIKNDKLPVIFEIKPISILFGGFLIIYLILLFLINKKQGGSIKHLFTGLQLHKDTDERDKHITGEAAKTTYLAAIIVLALAFVIPSILRTYEFLFNLNIDYYMLSIWSPVISMIVLNTTFSVKWCIEYKK
jgi:hypothetical protein